MRNPIFEAMGGNSQFMSKFQQFASTFQGDPRAQIQQLMNSGKISQQQYENAVNMANQIMKMMGK